MTWKRESSNEQDEESSMSPCHLIRTRSRSSVDSSVMGFQFDFFVFGFFVLGSGCLTIQLRPRGGGGAASLLLLLEEDDDVPQRRITNDK